MFFPSVIDISPPFAIMIIPVLSENKYNNSKNSINNNAIIKGTVKDFFSYLSKECPEEGKTIDIKEILDLLPS